MYRQEACLATDLNHRCKGLQSLAPTLHKASAGHPKQGDSLPAVGSRTVLLTARDNGCTRLPS